MMRRLFNRIRQAFGHADRKAGFTLLEVIVAAAAFTIICAGLTTLLVTSLRIQKYTTDNTNACETVRMVRAFVKDQAGNGVIAVDSSDVLKQNDVQILKYEDHALQVGGNTEPLVKGLDDAVQFDLSGKLLSFTLKMDGLEYPIAIYCPCN